MTCVMLQSHNICKNIPCNLHVHIFVYTTHIHGNIKNVIQVVSLCLSGSVIGKVLQHVKRDRSVVLGSVLQRLRLVITVTLSPSCWRSNSRNIFRDTFHQTSLWQEMLLIEPHDAYCPTEEVISSHIVSFHLIFFSNKWTWHEVWWFFSFLAGLLISGKLGSIDNCVRFPRGSIEVIEMGSCTLEGRGIITLWGSTFFTYFEGKNVIF